MTNKLKQTSKEWRHGFLARVFKSLMERPDPWDCFKKKGFIGCTCTPSLYKNLTSYCTCGFKSEKSYLSFCSPSRKLRR